MPFRSRFFAAASLALLLCRPAFALPAKVIKPLAVRKLSTQALNAALFKAIRADNTTLAESLLRQGANVNATDTGELSPLVDAVFRGQLAMCKMLIRHGAQVNLLVREPDTLLMRAIERSCPEIALALIQGGADVHAVGARGRRALDFLAEETVVDLEEADFGNVPQAQRAYVHNIAQLYAEEKKASIALTKVLVAKGANPNKVPPGGCLPLLVAINYRNNPVVLALLQAGADPSLIQKPFPSPLRAFCKYGETRGMTAYVIRSNGILLKPNELEALSSRAESRDLAIAAAMLSKGADVSKGDNRYALAEAAARGRKGVVKLLLDHGANPNIPLPPEPFILSPKDRADGLLTAEQAEEIEAEQNAQLNGNSGNTGMEANEAFGTFWPHGGQTALTLAAARGDFPVVQLLLAAGADATRDDTLGHTPLWLLAAGGRAAAIAEAERNIASIAGDVRKMDRVAYDIAAPLPKSRTEELLKWSAEGDSATAAALIARGCPVDAPGKDGSTPLQLAALQGSPRLVETLLQSGAKMTTAAGNELIHRIISGGRRQTRAVPMLNIIQLVSADLEETESHYGTLKGVRGETLKQPEKEKKLYAEVRADMFKQRRYFMETWGEQDAATVQALLAHGAHPDTRDATGLTPLMHCARTGNIEVARVLLKAGADANASSPDGETVIAQVQRYGLQSQTLSAPRPRGRASSSRKSGASPSETLPPVPESRTALIRTEWAHEDAAMLTLLRQHGATN